MRGRRSEKKFWGRGGEKFPRFQLRFLGRPEILAGKVFTRPCLQPAAPVRMRRGVLVFRVFFGASCVSQAGGFP